MNELIISCDTCIKVNECDLNIGYKCLDGVSEYFIHPKYPFYERRYNIYAYRNWEPKENLCRPTMLLTDEDFEL